MEALSKESQRGCTFEKLYADDLVTMNMILNGLIDKLTTWENSLQSKELKKTMKKTKGHFSNLHKGITENSEKYPYAVCHIEIDSNSILCNN